MIDQTGLSDGMIRLVLFLVLFSIFPLRGADLVMPPVIYGVPGIPVKIVFRNAALIAPGKTVPFTCECKIGEVIDDQHWVLQATQAEVGDHVLTLRSGDHEIKTIIRVVPENAGQGREISLLLVGDSLTHASVYPNEVARRLSLPGNPEWKMPGTHRPGSAAKNVAHEGYGGWTWNRFNTKWAPDQSEEGKLRNSPFLVFENGAQKLDIARYLQKDCGGVNPDFVTFLLGINDCFHANPDDPAAIETKIDAMMVEAEKLIGAFREASPSTEIGICLTPPPNDRDAAFVANYKDRYTRWGWRRIQFRLVQRQMEQFGNREAENIYLVPTAVGIDPMEGYPENNGVHPNQAGYETIGDEIYSWLKWRLSARN